MQKSKQSFFATVDFFFFQNITLLLSMRNNFDCNRKCNNKTDTMLELVLVGPILEMQRCQILRFVRNYYTYEVNITMLWAAVKKYGFLILNIFFSPFLNFKLESLNIA